MKTILALTVGISSALFIAQFAQARGMGGAHGGGGGGYHGGGEAGGYHGGGGQSAYRGGESGSALAAVIGYRRLDKQREPRGRCGRIPRWRRRSRRLSRRGAEAGGYHAGGAEAGGARAGGAAAGGYRAGGAEAGGYRAGGVAAGGVAAGGYTTGGYTTGGVAVDGYQYQGLQVPPAVQVALPTDAGYSTTVVGGGAVGYGAVGYGAGVRRPADIMPAGLKRAGPGQAVRRREERAGGGGRRRVGLALAERADPETKDAGGPVKRRDRTRFPSLLLINNRPIVKTLHTVTAVIEIGAGFALVCDPSAMVGAPGRCAAGGARRIDGGTHRRSRSAGAGCRILARARNAQSRAAIALIAAILIYNVAVVVILVFAGIDYGLHGVALWPPVFLHAAMTVWCVA